MSDGDWLEGPSSDRGGIGCTLVVAAIAIGFAAVVFLWKHGIILQ